VEAEPLVNIASGAKAEGLILQKNGLAPARVRGVRLHEGVIEADVVVDAAGRRSPIRGFLKAAGVSMPAGLKEPCGIIYYCRYYRLQEGADYPAWTGVLGPGGTTDCLRFSTFFGDNRTFAIVLGIPASSHALRGLAREDAFTVAVSRFESLAPFIDCDVSDPTTGVIAFGSLQNVFHPPLLNGRPPVIGLHFIGDAYCHTNPLFA
jgi:hypothetical protein